MWFPRPFSKLLPVALALVGAGILLAQQMNVDGELQQASADLAQGKTGEADQRITSVLQHSPDNVQALTMKAVIEDSEKLYDQAETHYRRAIQLAPNSAPVLNNFANHLLATGHRAEARQWYLKTIAADPHHLNANLQLGQMSIAEKRGAEALVYLGHVNAAGNTDPNFIVLTAQAYALVGKCPDAVRLLGNIEGQTNGSPALTFSAGMIFADCKLDDKAENAFSRVLDQEPTDFEALYNLGLASLEAGHLDRASNVLETALKERPGDTDCMYALARAYLKQEKALDAAELLAKAQQSAPRRADVALLLAQVSARLGDFNDAANEYDRYLQLRPNDDLARREYGFMLGCANRPDHAIQELQPYVRKHPSDAAGFYELGIARAVARDRKGALRDLDRAVLLNPALGQARYARALLNIEDQRSLAAVEDLRSYLDHHDDDFRALTHLGQAYLALNRNEEAAEALKRAMDVAPNAQFTIVEYRTALIRLGRLKEADMLLPKLKDSEFASGQVKSPTSLAEYLSLTPADQRARDLAALRLQATAQNANPALKVQLGRELLFQGKVIEASNVFRELQATPLDPPLLEESGRILLDANQFDIALQFLQRATTAAPARSSARLDLAIARFHVDTPERALAELDQIPAAERKGDYWLLRAQILDAQGNVNEAAQALNRGIRAAPTRPDLYLEAAGFLIKHDLLHEAFDLLNQAIVVLPDARELLLAQAVTLDLLRREPEAQNLLAKIQVRWPEWNSVYVVSGMILQNQLKSAEARQTLETAIALGANSPQVYYYQAKAILDSTPSDLDGAEKAITHALSLTNDDPYIFLLAGKISLAEKNYSQALERLTAAERLQPKYIPTHYALRETYKALGDEPNATAQVEIIKDLAKDNPGQDTNPFALESFLFSVRSPR